MNEHHYTLSKHARIVFAGLFSLVAIIFLFLTITLFIKPSFTTSPDKPTEVVDSKDTATTTSSLPPEGCAAWGSSEYATHGTPLEVSDNITKTHKVSAYISCDRTKIIISGDSNQELTLTDQELIDPFAKDMGFDHDYNFDGYKDFYTHSSDGQGQMSIDFYNIWLFDPQTSKFVFNKALSEQPNILVIDETRKVIGYYNPLGWTQFQYMEFSWKSGALSQEVARYSCDASTSEGEIKDTIDARNSQWLRYSIIFGSDLSTESIAVYSQEQGCPPPPALDVMSSVYNRMYFQ